MTDQPTEAGPTAEDQAAAQKVSSAMVEAAAAESDPAGRQDAMVKAGKQEAERQNLPLTEDDLKKLAGMLGPIVSDGVIDRMDARGMFEPAPEPVQPPPHAEPAPTGIQPNGDQAAPPPSEPQAPRRRSFAERFFGE